jgi:hypothetical protein
MSDIIDERAKTHGDYPQVSRMAQKLKRAMRRGKNWRILPDTQKEALEMVATKIARMLSGDHLYLDNVVDIIGYMTLLERQLKGVDCEGKKVD